MRWFERVIAAHRAVTPQVSHGKRLKSERYFVWQEDGAHDLEANDRHEELVITGVTDLFTRRDLDPWADALGEALSAQGIAWRLVSADYEEETGLWHYSWDWEVLDGGKNSD
ncbi:hypothetical protein AALC17_05185 [Oscillospiraceae bacterium 38-13]